MARIDETKIIDREAEAEVFVRMLDCETPRRILVVSDKSGMGKTDVLRKLRYMCEYVHDVPVALIPLEDFTNRPDVFVLASRLRDELSRGGAVFPSFDELNGARSFGDAAHFSERLRSVHGVVDLRDADVSGAARVAGTMFNIERAENVTLPPWNEAAERQAQILCIEAFLKDLMACCQERPIVLLFDTLEQAGEELQRWLFLDLVRKRVLSGWKRHKLIVALAGQDVADRLGPRLRPEDVECIEPIASLSTWELHHVAEFLKVYGYGDFTPEEIKVIHDLLGLGQTLTNALIFAKLMKSGP